MKRKFTCLSTLFVIFAVVITGCGSETEALPSPTPIPPSSTPIPPTSTPQPPTPTPVPPTAVPATPTPNPHAEEIILSLFETMNEAFSSGVTKTEEIANYFVEDATGGDLGVLMVTGRDELVSWLEINWIDPKFEHKISVFEVSGNDVKFYWTATGLGTKEYKCTGNATISGQEIVYLVSRKCRWIY